LPFMPRVTRVTPGGLAFHVLNRANGRAPIFQKPADYGAFERVLVRTVEYAATRILSYSVLPNHWHLVLWPYGDGDLAAFMQRLTTTHVRRWHLHRHTVGHGHLYQGPFKAFPVQTDEHRLTVRRYVERNPVRAGLVRHAEHWPWESAWGRTRTEVSPEKPTLADWPLPMPPDGSAFVNPPLTDAEIEACRLCARRGRPSGDASWTTRIANRLGLHATLRPRGRPRRAADATR